MCSNHGVMGWPGGFKGEATTGWKTLATLPDDWGWLSGIIGDSTEYRSALSAYYMMLNFFEYVEQLSTSVSQLAVPKNIRLEIPICYESESDEILRRAYSILLADPDALRAIWRTRNISDLVVKSNWDAWLEVCSGFISGVYPYAHRYQITHKDLIKDLL